MSFSGLTKVVLGFTIAIALLVGGSVAAILSIVAKLTALPPKPVFDNPPPVTAQTTPTATPTPTPTPTSTPTPTPEAEALPPGAYRVRITWPQGLLIRTSPDFGSANIGGIAANQQAIALEASEDGKWLRIRMESTSLEGWVVGQGTLERLDGQ